MANRSNLGFRQAQIRDFAQQRLQEGAPFPSLGELKRELGFYDKAGALRALRGLIERTRLTTTPDREKR